MPPIHYEGTRMPELLLDNLPPQARGFSPSQRLNYLMLQFQSGRRCVGLWLGFHFSLIYTPHKNSIRFMRFITLLVRVTRCNGKEASIPAKRECGNASWIPWILIQAFLVIAVPDIDVAIATTSCKRSIYWVKRNSIDWVNCISPRLRLPMALKSIFFLLVLSQTYQKIP